MKQERVLLLGINDEFIVDVLKTKDYIEKMDEVVKLFTLSDFHGNLQDYFIGRGTYFTTTNNFSIGYPDCSVDTNGRLNLKFENIDLSKYLLPNEIK